MSPILLASVAALSTLIGGWAAVHERRRVYLLLGFGAGTLLGATFFVLLPEAVNAASLRGWSAQNELTRLVIGFVVLHVAERFFHACPTCDSELNCAGMSKVL